MRFFRDLGASLERRRFLTYCGVALAVESVVFLFLVAGTLIVPAGILPAFVVAIIATVIVQGASQWAFARRREPRYA